MPEKKGVAALRPPAHLDKTTAKWFKTVLDEYELEPHHVRLLTLAAEAWDRCQAARTIIDSDGMTYTDRFGQPKPRPEIAIERDSRIGFARLIRELALDVEPPPESPRMARTRDYGARR
ncbi:P27 family phage terminase small subunit [Mesorhizobium sp. YM1C-6-2]|uniref:P27 family phage terminase small subunit n=1 Tax=Mesorhizobium sp. YM1C-6-2 TaxID=1827501 RepID=UPI000EF1EBA9|nr:P27 family phage terminase small subunit [Mesorhizobium sp. YM1C-6-2]RLP22212.1 hypothetical protein D8676_25465 [Mesorhizobium sp. YM1C-6-2]